MLLRILLDPPHTGMKNHNVDKNIWLHMTTLPTSETFIELQFFVFWQFYSIETGPHHLCLSLTQ